MGKKGIRPVSNSANLIRFAYSHHIEHLTYILYGFASDFQLGSSDVKRIQGHNFFYCKFPRQQRLKLPVIDTKRHVNPNCV